ncbi:MAG: alpha/beta family hydrolase [Patescibacteria group bacterium]|nr:dienelactone hydrolase family protein [Patescibacteria group bacterium]MBU2509020.1 dienelactone hydrolase family protein [Patescibacteria group bacterium]
MNVKIPINRVELDGILTIPEKAHGLVIFAHGSGSSRLSPRNTLVAEELNKAGLATLLFDLLTEKEDAFRESRFNIELLTERLALATKWVLEQPYTRHLSIGYFGASTGAAAALIAAAKLGATIRAVVSRGGRPDLAEDGLEKILTPVLLIVGGDDTDVIKLNQISMDQMTCEKKLEIVSGATHLFEEPETLEKVAKLAAEWFKRYLIKSSHLPEMSVEILIT